MNKHNNAEIKQKENIISLVGKEFEGNIYDRITDVLKTNWR